MQSGMLLLLVGADGVAIQANMKLEIFCLGRSARQNFAPSDFDPLEPRAYTLN